MFRLSQKPRSSARYVPICQNYIYVKIYEFMKSRNLRTN